MHMVMALLTHSQEEEPRRCESRGLWECGDQQAQSRQDTLTRYAMQTRALKTSGRVSGDTFDRSSCMNSALLPRKELMNCKTHIMINPCSGQLISTFA